jgi:glycosyltransferase involved in cell wall biosynthesis
MLVSVVIPTKNRPTPITNVISSVLAGTYQDFEIFVIDQSTNDQTRIALETFADDARIHYVKNTKPGVGAASSRNVGIALSNGPLIGILDDDVTANPDWLERIVKEFVDDADLDFIFGKLTAPPYDPSTGFTPAFTPRPEERKWRVALKVAAANLAMRRRLFDRIGAFDEFCGPGGRLFCNDDGDITFRTIRSGAKWKACPDIEVVHTYGFRNAVDAEVLYTRSSRGLGGAWGRFTRRGDYVAGAYFLSREVLQFARSLKPLIVDRNTRPVRDVYYRLEYFVYGFLLPPTEGFVTADDLKRYRQQYDPGLETRPGRVFASS